MSGHLMKRIMSSYPIKRSISNSTVKRLISSSTIKPIPIVQELSRCAIKPKCLMEGRPNTSNLTPWGVSLISLQYGQLGLLFSKPPSNLPMESIFDTLKESFSRTLTHFPHLAGRLKTEKCSDSPPTYSISVNCSNPPGAVFVSAEAKDAAVSDITSPCNYLNNPNLVNSLFAFRGEIAYDGHDVPLLGVQVTRLLDGIFISCSINHGLSDATSVWHFIQSWSEISLKMIKNPSGDHEYEISHPPIINKNWVMEKYGPVIKLLFNYYSEIQQNAPPPPPPLSDRIFHIPGKSIARLKAQANAECFNPNNRNSISSFQAFNAFLWRCVSRARRLRADQETRCLLTVNDRPRLSPPLSQQHFGCHIQCLAGTTTAGELLSNNLGWSAWLLHQAVIEHNTERVHTFLDDFVKNPSPAQIFFKNSLLVENSPRLDVYSNDFGLGKPVAVRSGYGNKNDGAVFAYQGREGGGSMELETFLAPESMYALVSDDEFMDMVSS